MFPPWPSCLGGPGDPCRGPAVLSVWPLPESEAQSRLLSSPASGRRRALPTPPGRELELLPPQMPRPAWPCGLACATREGGVLRRQNATRSGTRRARRSRPLAQRACPGVLLGAGAGAPRPDCSHGETAQRQGGCVSFYPPLRSGERPPSPLQATSRTLLLVSCPHGRVRQGRCHAFVLSDSEKLVVVL